MYNFHDAKLWGLRFNFEASPPSSIYDLILDLDYPIHHEWDESGSIITTFCPCYLYFKSTSAFSINLSSGVVIENPTSYQSDSLYIMEINKTQQGGVDAIWVIDFIDNIGQIRISCEEVKLRLFEDFSIKIPSDYYIPLDIRKDMRLPPV